MKAEIGTTKQGEVSVSLWDGPVLVLKAYPSGDGKRVRIVLPEMHSEKQVLGEVNPPVPYIEFRRKL